MFSGPKKMGLTLPQTLVKKGGRVLSLLSCTNADPSDTFQESAKEKKPWHSKFPISAARPQLQGGCGRQWKQLRCKGD